MYISPSHEYDCSAPYLGQPFKLQLPEMKAGQPLLLVPAILKEALVKQTLLPVEYFLPGKATGMFSVGTTFTSGNNPIFTVVLRIEIPAAGRLHSLPCIRVVCHRDIPEGELILTPCRSAPALAWITVSDKGSLGEREDNSGPLIDQLVRSSISLRCSSGYIVPDDVFRLRAAVTDLALVQGYDIIITSGGTGLSERDTTPEAVLPLVEKRLHGFELAMMNASLKKTSHAIISRPVCGSIGESILITLPGSVKAVQENLEAVLPAIQHALDKLQGSRADCGI